jgi:hypothetical protein
MTLTTSLMTTGSTGTLVVPSAIGRTEPLERAAMAFRLMEAERDISCFDGPPGSGKTTAAAVAANESALSWRYCVLPLRANPREITAAVYTAVFNRDADGTERQMSTVLRKRLMDGDIGIIADEIHHCGVTGAQQLRYLWDGASISGSPFPLLLIGANVREQLSKAEEVRSRVARWVRFDQITDPDDIRAIATALHPRLGACSDEVLARINDVITRRSIRNWHQIGKHVKHLPDSQKDTKNPKPLTATEIKYLRDLTGVDEVAAA